MGAALSRRLHLAVVIDYDQGSILSHDVEMAIEDYLKSRHAKATAVIVASATHERLRQACEHPWERHGDYDG